jgi:neutral ceramidase
MNSFYEAGVAKEDMTAFVPGVGMMGYGQPHNVVQEIGTRLWVRALFLKDETGSPLLFIHCEQAFVSMALKEEILQRIQTAHPDWGITDENLVLSAQHTHAAPGGYTHFPFYNLTISNFQTKVFEKVASASLLAAESARKNLQKVNLSWGSVEISPDKEIAFNRSMKAYLNNPDVQKIKEEEKTLGLDRQMQGVLIRNTEGKLLAHLNWFGVHCTNVSSFNTRTHHDNKGVAAELFEKNHPGSIAFFFQSTAGDVSPNFVWDKKKNLMRGKFEDQYDNASFNGEIQFREAEKIEGRLPVKGKFETVLNYVDMGKKAAPPAHGLAFFKGTLEGPGISSGLASILRITSRIRRVIDCARSPECRDFYRKHGAKDVVIDHRNGSFVGIPFNFWNWLPVVPSHPLNVFQTTAKSGGLKTLPWIPSVIPFQIVRLGNILIAALPGEITTVAGRRVKDLLEKEYEGCGVERVIIHSYCNAYMGYITTAEEYDIQSYEGGHNVYGRSSLHVVLETYRDLVKTLKGEPCEIERATPLRFPPEELKLRSV